jgi:hypothetical protein
LPGLNGHDGDAASRAAKICDDEIPLQEQTITPASPFLKRF